MGSGLRVPLSLMQESMWWLERYAPSPGFFNEVLRHRFSSPVDPALLTEALGVVTRRHESLRTTFPTVSADQPYQSIAPSVDIELGVSDLSSLPADERARQLVRLEVADAEAPFDIAQGPLLRAHLLQLGDGAGELFVVFDHLVSDPTSQAIFVSELDEAYAALSAGGEPALGPVGLDFADFAVWQRRWMTDERLAEHRGYWRTVLEGVSPEQRVPYSTEVRDTGPEDRSDLTQPPAMYAFNVPPAVCAALRRLPRSSGFVLCAAAVAALVARATGEPDVLLATSVDGRDRAELAGMVGLFGGMSLLRIDLGGDPPFDLVVRRARAAVLGVLEHQQLPLYPALQSVRDGGIDVPLSAIPVAVHFFHAAHHRWVPGASIVARPPERDGPVEPDLPDASKPLEFRFYDDGTALWGELLYHRDYFNGRTALQAVSDLNALLAAVSADPMLRLSQLPVAAKSAGSLDARTSRSSGTATTS